MHFKTQNIMKMEKKTLPPSLHYIIVPLFLSGVLIKYNKNTFQPLRLLQGNLLTQQELWVQLILFWWCTNGMGFKLECATSYQAVAKSSKGLMRVVFAPYTNSVAYWWTQFDTRFLLLWRPSLLHIFFFLVDLVLLF